LKEKEKKEREKKKEGFSLLEESQNFDFFFSFNSKCNPRKTRSL